MANERLVYVTRDEMSGREKAFHALMLVLTLGLWYPVYAVRKSSAKHNKKTYQVGMHAPVFEQTTGRQHNEN